MISGWHYLSKAIYLIRPHLFHACFEPWSCNPAAETPILHRFGVLNRHHHHHPMVLLWLENKLPGNRLPRIMPSDWTRESWSKQSTGTMYKNHRVPWICVSSSLCFTDSYPQELGDWICRENAVPGNARIWGLGKAIAKGTAHQQPASQVSLEPICGFPGFPWSADFTDDLVIRSSGSQICGFPWCAAFPDMRLSLICGFPWSAAFPDFPGIAAVVPWYAAFPDFPCSQTPVDLAEILSQQILVGRLGVDLAALRVAPDAGSITSQGGLRVISTAYISEVHSKQRRHSKWE